MTRLAVLPPRRRRCRRHIGLRIDRVAPLDKLRQHGARVPLLAAAAGCCGAIPARTTRRDRRAAIPKRRASRSRAGRRIHKGAAAGRQNMSGLREQPGDDPALAVAKHRLAASCERFPRWFRRPPPRSRYPNRRTANSAAPPGGARSLVLPAPINPTRTIVRWHAKPLLALPRAPLAGSGFSPCSSASLAALPPRHAGRVLAYRAAFSSTGAARRGHGTDGLGHGKGSDYPRCHPGPRDRRRLCRAGLLGHSRARAAMSTRCCRMRGSRNEAACRLGAIAPARSVSRNARGRARRGAADDRRLPQRSRAISPGFSPRAARALEAADADGAARLSRALGDRAAWRRAPRRGGCRRCASSIAFCSPRACARDDPTAQLERRASAGRCPRSWPRTRSAR